MRALVFNGKLRFEMSYPDPSMEEGEALIRVLCVGICNTDLEIVKGYMSYSGIVGHEFVGVVEDCHDQRWIGKRVVGEINCGCGSCRICQNGIEKHCPERTVLGIVRRNGVCADYITLPVENLHMIPDSIADEEAVFVEPLAAAFRVVEQVPIASSHKVIVLGDGKLGLLVVQVMQMMRCDLTLIGKHESKLRIAQQQGIAAAFAEQYKGGKADVVVDCTGSPDGFESALGLTRPEGILILKSTFAQKANLNMSPIVVDEMTLIGSRCGPFGPAIDGLARGVIRVKPLVTRIMPFEMGVEAFGIASQRETLKVLLRVSS
ncbi:MAG: alcohol dehydrogenase catalytic domain-containing protein [Gemmatimonadota bacterium]|nr:MAG: alcohol dehydrogenase catalytic domain-containing protein [Gemmatimonadota bacterium]